MSASLTSVLREIAPEHPLLAAVGDQPGASAAVDITVAVERVADAAVIQATVTGPGEANARMLDLSLTLDDAVLWTMRGGRFEAVYPPEAFAPVARTLHPRLPFPWPDRLATIEFGSIDGRSSDGDMPFFLVTDLSGEVGWWIAPGWSGQWRAGFKKAMRAGRHDLWVEGPGAGVELAAGESLVLPRVYVAPFEGDGWEAIRRHLATTAPRRHQPWVVYNSWFNENAGITEDNVLQNVAVAADIGFDAYCIDAAWYETPGDDLADFQTRGLGTWTLDEQKFPNGLEVVAEAVRAQGMTFGLWFEPERAHPDSTVAAEHPEWIRRPDGEEFGLVDFAIPEARQWAVDLMVAAVERWSLGWIKWDMNFQKFRPFFAGDERGELAFARGVWAAMDELVDRCPDLILEGCASGGNRIDIEILNRCHTYWISDQTISPDVVRATMSGARRILPAQYCYLSLSPQLEPRSDDFPDEWFVGNMNGVFGIMEQLRLWSPELRAKARDHVSRFKAIRHLLDGDYVRFADGAEAGVVPLSRWEAWEFSDPATGEAALLALRLNSPDETRTFTGRHTWTVALPPGGATVEHRPARSSG